MDTNAILRGLDKWRHNLSYVDHKIKVSAHKAMRRILKAFAMLHLGLTEDQFDLRSNYGGIAVSGEVTLHTENLYVQVSQSSFGSDHYVLYRTCKGRKDYTGGPNNWASLDIFTDVERLQRIVELFENTKIWKGYETIHNS